MTQENKELLLKDLCARLPYGVKVQVYYEDIAGSGYFDEAVWLIDNDEPFHVNDRWIENIKPYLRPMSSMTEEEYKSVSWEGCSHTYNYSSKSGFQFIEIKTFTLNILNWLNAHHFDYRGLIEKGLAIKAPEGMYK